MELCATFGASLRRQREDAGLTQEELASNSGLHRTTIGLLERGKREPRLETIFKLAKGLGKGPGELLEGVAREQAFVERGVIGGLLERALDVSYELRERGDLLKLTELENLLLKAMAALEEALAIVKGGKEGSFPENGDESRRGEGRAWSSEGEGDGGDSIE